MSRIRAFAAFLYDFIVGDDPLIAVAIVGGLAATAAITAAGVNAWWLLPPIVFAVLAVSLVRATRH